MLKRRLALLEPNVNTAAFAYEEGEGLEPDEVNPACLVLMTDCCNFWITKAGSKLEVRQLLSVRNACGSAVALSTDGSC